jgi:Domain of unknown function (DUF1844)
MSEAQSNTSPLFLHLFLSLQSAAMYQMGKIISPISGKIEREMDQARVTIDMLVMIQEKTKGNLQDDEKRLLDSMIYDLQMNYIEELNRDKTGGGADAPKAPTDISEQTDKAQESGA